MRALILLPFALVLAFNAAAEEFKPTSLRSSRTMRLFKDGRYAFESRHVVSVSGAGTATSGDKEAGTWKVVGDSLFLQPQDGEAYQVPVSLKDGMVTAGGKRYLPCR